MYTTYLLPVEIRAKLMTDQEVIPASQSYLRTFCLSLHQIDWNGLGSSNPWTGNGTASLGRFALQLPKYDLKDPSLMEASLDTVVSLPKITSIVNLEQTSTTSRFLNGAIDASCFDISYSIEMFPFTLKFQPQNLMSGNRLIESDGLGSTQIWRNTHSLGHLTLPSARWARNPSNLSKELFKRSPLTVGSTKSHKQQAEGVQVGGEARTRLGDWYTEHPRFCNVVSELWATLLIASNHVTENSDDLKDLLPQDLRVRCMTAGKPVDLNISMNAPTMASIIRLSRPMGGASIDEIEEATFVNVALDEAVPMEASVVLGTPSPAPQDKGTLSLSHYML
jgi:hypothetical protein